MSLLVWLPMTKDLSNQGLENISITNNGAILDTNGKLGKCYSFGTSTSNLILPNEPIKACTTECSLSMWLNIITWNTSYATYFQAGLGGAPWAHYIFGVLRNDTGSNLCFTISNGSTSSQASYTTPTLTLNTWYHLVFVYKTGHCLIYINGELYQDYTTTIIPNFSAITKTTIGACNTTSSYQTNCKLNDVRIYDHALSAKEVELLARGLVCHYPLNSNGGGQPNLYDFESVASKWAIEGLTLVNATDDVYGNVLKITSPSSVSSQRIYRTVSNVWKADQKFTVSFLAKASKTAVVKMSRSLANYAPDVTIGTTWKRYSTVITCSTTVEGGTLSVQTSTASADIYITQIKLELGDKATAYCPGVGDSHYIPLGYDSATIYDCSGYQNNATPWAYDNTGSIDISNGTARYSTSTFINSANPSSGQAAGTRYIYGNCELTKPEKLTVAFWCKAISGYGGGTAHGQFSLTNYDIGANAGADYQSGPLNHRDSGFDINGITGTTYTHKRLDVNFTANQWHHYVITYDGRYGKLYKDAVQVSSADMGAIMPLGDMKGIVIGFSKAGGVWRHVQSYYSDVRIYTTALSAEDIKELYQTAATIDKNGTLLGYELVEV